MTTNQIISKYGHPHIAGYPYLITIELPYPMRLSWDLETEVKRMRCHEKVAANFLAVFAQIECHYGYNKIKELGIDLFGGCFNYRNKRGGSAWSTHSWGIAIDLDPVRNQLRETKRTARFARPEYKPMIDIFYKNGFISLGVEKDFDWMHFEIKE